MSVVDELIARDFVARISPTRPLRKCIDSLFFPSTNSNHKKNKGSNAKEKRQKRLEFKQQKEQQKITNKETSRANERGRRRLRSCQVLADVWGKKKFIDRQYFP